MLSKALYDRTSRNEFVDVLLTASNDDFDTDLDFSLAAFGT